MNRKEGEKRGNYIDSSSFDLDTYSEYQELKSLYEKLKDKYNISTAELISKLEEKEVLIPDCIFNEKQSTFNSISKYLRENLEFGNKEIASLINRSEKSVWQSYNSARKKIPFKFDIKPSKYYIPVSSIKNRSLTVFESVVTYLKDDLGLNYHKIAVLLKRNDRTIWTVYQRAIKKRKSG